VVEGRSYITHVDPGFAFPRELSHGPRRRMEQDEPVIVFAGLRLYRSFFLKQRATAIGGMLDQPDPEGHRKQEQ